MLDIKRLYQGHGPMENVRAYTRAEKLAWDEYKAALELADAVYAEQVDNIDAKFKPQIETLHKAWDKERQAAFQTYCTLRNLFSYEDYLTTVTQARADLGIEDNE